MLKYEEGTLSISQGSASLLGHCHNTICGHQFTVTDILFPAKILLKQG